MCDKTIVDNRIMEKSLGVKFLVMLCFCMALAFNLSNGTAAYGAQKADEDEMLTEEHYAMPNFSSPMPILVLDAPEEALAKDPDGYFLSSHIEVFYGQEANALARTPSISADVSFRNMSDKLNAWGTLRKSDYYLRLEEAQSLMGLDASKEYLLLGGMKDKSLIRNYIGYSLAAKVRQEDKEHFKLCELFFRSDKGDLYQGVYLLVELQIPESGVLFHRNETQEGIVINTYSSENDPNAGYITIPFIESVQWDDRLSEPIGAFSTAESVLYSPNPSVFYGYSDLFDTNSFIQSFIVGELTENYAQMTDAYYSYDLETQLISSLPIWNFEEAFDNAQSNPVSVKQIQYHKVPYYEQFFRSPQFASELQKHYLQGRRTTLGEDAIAQMTTEAANYVAPAVSRDWSRWENYSGFPLRPLTEIEDEDEEMVAVEPAIRQTTTYDQELLRIKYHLREHNLNMALRLTQFDFSEQEINREIVLNTNPIWMILFLLAFFYLVRFARRYGV